MGKYSMLSGIATICLALASQSNALAVKQPHSPRAIYFQRAYPSGQNVVAIPIGPDGLLQNKSSSTSTHGTGKPGLDGPNPGAGPFSPDILATQDSVIVDGNYLFTVNTGSNTAVMFEINPENPLELKMIGAPVPTIGTYPAAIAYSSLYHTACVINGGVTNGITCFYVDPVRGLIPDGQGLRNTHLDLPPEPIHHGTLGSASDIRFAPDSSSLLAVFKGNFTPATTAPIMLYDVSPTGQVSTTAKNASNPYLSFAFGAVYDHENYSNVYVTDALLGGGVFMSLNPTTGKSTTLSVNANTTDQLGGCWVVYSELKNAFYEISLASPTVAVINADTGALDDLYYYVDAEGSLNDLLGGTDTAIDGNLLYFVRSNSNNITVIDINSKKVVQQFPYSTMADRTYWAGLAVYTGWNGF